MRLPRQGTASLASEAVGAAAAAAAALQFGAVVVLGKLAGRRGLPVPSMLAVRFAMAALVLAVVLAALHRSLRAAPGEGWTLALLGGVGYAAESGLFFFALRHGTAAAVSLLFFTYPVWVTGLAALTGRGLPGALVAGSLVSAVAGAALVVASAGGLDINGLGIGLALAASVTFSAYLIAVDTFLRRSSSLAASLWVSVGASAGLALFALVSRAGRLPDGGAEWWPVVGMGAFTAGAFLGLFIGLRRLGPVRTSVVAALEPVATAILALIFLSEALQPLTAVGGALIVGGAVTASVARRQPAPERSVP